MERPVSCQNERSWKSKDVELRGCLLSTEKNGISYVEFINPGLDALERSGLHLDSDDPHVLSLVFISYRFEIRYFVNARGGPRRTQIQDHDLSFKIVGLHGITRDLQKIKLWRGHPQNIQTFRDPHCLRSK